MSKLVLGVAPYSRGGGGAYSRVGHIYSSQFKSGGSFLRHIRANKYELFILYFRRIVFSVNIVFITNHVFRSVTKYEIE